MSRDCLVVMFTITCIFKVCVKSSMDKKYVKYCKPCNLNFFTLGDTFFGESIFNMYSNDL